MSQSLEDIADELGVEIDDVDEQLYDDFDSETVEIQAKEATIIKPFEAGKGLVKDETFNTMTETGDQASITVKYRPRCPSCSHVLAEQDKPNQLSGECTKCGIQTCHRNQSICEGCEQVFCPQHASGHGLKDSSYCEMCVRDVREDVEFEREMDEMEQQYQAKIQMLDKRLETEIERKEMKLKKLKQEKNQEREDYQTMIQLLTKVQELNEMKDRSSSQGKDNKPFSDTGAFDRDNSNRSDDSLENVSDVPEWFGSFEN